VAISSSRFGRHSPPAHQTGPRDSEPQPLRSKGRPILGSEVYLTEVAGFLGSTCLVISCRVGHASFPRASARHLRTRARGQVTSCAEMVACQAWPGYRFRTSSLTLIQWRMNSQAEHRMSLLGPQLETNPVRPCWVCKTTSDLPPAWHFTTNPAEQPAGALDGALKGLEDWLHRLSEVCFRQVHVRHDGVSRSAAIDLAAGSDRQRSSLPARRGLPAISQPANRVPVRSPRGCCLRTRAPGAARGSSAPAY